MPRPFYTLSTWARWAGILRVAAAALVSAAAPSIAAAAMEHSSVVLKNPVDYTPELVATKAVPKPRVDAIARIGNTMFIAGLFEQVASAGAAETYPRNNFAAFDALTGVVRTDIAPNFDGQIRAMEAFGDAIFVGGQFTTVDGITRRRLVKLDAATGAVDTRFDAKFTGGTLWDLQM